MKMKVTIAATLIALLISNVAAARYSDDYRAKYPKRVKVTTDRMSNGKMATKTAYKLFDKKLKNGRLKLDVEKNSASPDLCFLTFSTYGHRGIRPIKQITYGDGQKTHEIKLFHSGVVHPTVGSFAELAIAVVRPEELKKAVTLDAGIVPIISDTSKEWKEWREALDSAEIILNERFVKGK